MNCHDFIGFALCRPITSAENSSRSDESHYRSFCKLLQLTKLCVEIQISYVLLDCNALFIDTGEIRQGAQRLQIPPKLDWIDPYRLATSIIITCSAKGKVPTNTPVRATVDPNSLLLHFVYFLLSCFSGVSRIRI